MKYLIIGSNKEPTAEFYNVLKLSKSILFNRELNNFSVYHTSIADCADLENYITHFDKIYWANSDISEFSNFTEYLDTLCLVKKYNGIEADTDPYNIKQTFSINNTVNSAIYLGCSHTAGIGLLDQSTNYTNLVSNYFSADILNLSMPGKGNYRSFDIFKNIDFYPNQLLILQLTDLARLRYFKNDLASTLLSESQLYTIPNRSYIDVFNDKQLLSNFFENLEFVVQLARLKKLRFVFFNLGGNSDGDNDKEKNQFRTLTEYYLQDYKEYIPNILSKNIDRGTDGVHFGPLSHKIWADSIIEKIENLY